MTSRASYGLLKQHLAALTAFWRRSRRLFGLLADGNMVMEGLPGFRWLMLLYLPHAEVSVCDAC
jgi:hypothetical protein